MDLEFEVSVAGGVSNHDLEARLQQEVVRLEALLERRVLDVRVGDDEVVTGPHVRQGAEELQRQANDRAASTRAEYELLNHPTTPRPPSFLRKNNYWEDHQGTRICERKQAEERERRAKAAELRPFHALPVPAAVSAQRYQSMLAAEEFRRAMSPDHTPSQRGRAAEPRSASEERPPRFRARPVPWQVSAPLYRQLLVEEQRALRGGDVGRKPSPVRLPRASSLPPRLENVRGRILGDSLGSDRIRRHRTPSRELEADVPPAQKYRIYSHGDDISSVPTHAAGAYDVPWKGSLPPECGYVNAYDDLADAGPAGGGPGEPWSGPSFYGPVSGSSRVDRHRTPPNYRRSDSPNRTYKTTKVPDFVALHEREKLRLERRKQANRWTTQPAPFNLTAVDRARSRQALFQKDPALDWRFDRPHSARASSVGAARNFGPREGEGHFSVAALERPATVAPPRPTLKTVQAQRRVQQMLAERREGEELKAQEDQHVRHAEMRALVKRAAYRVPLEEKIERIVEDKREVQRRVAREKRHDLLMIKERVRQRSLLMERTDQLDRARRQALFKVKRIMEDAGVNDVDCHFDFGELDEMERAVQSLASSGT